MASSFVSTGDLTWPTRSAGVSCACARSRASLPITGWYDGTSCEGIASRFERPVVAMKTWLLQRCAARGARPMSEEEEIDGLAAEYVLGSLSPAVRCPGDDLRKRAR